MEKYCPNCHLPNSSDAMFCRQCATPLPAAVGNQQAAQPNQAQYQNLQWNQPQGAGFQANANAAPQTGQNSSRATAAMILAICGVFCCGPFTGIPAAILGWLEMGAIREGHAPSEGMTKAQIGLWGGVIGTILGFLGYFILAVMSMMNRY
jgi:hypothetical protein